MSAAVAAAAAAAAALVGKPIPRAVEAALPKTIEMLPKAVTKSADTFDGLPPLSISGTVTNAGTTPATESTPSPPSSSAALAMAASEENSTAASKISAAIAAAALLAASAAASAATVVVADAQAGSGAGDGGAGPPAAKEEWELVLENVFDPEIDHSPECVSALHKLCMCSLYARGKCCRAFSQPVDL
jgi:hypothetical protein